jgi:hypothetical protein
LLLSGIIFISLKNTQFASFGLLNSCCEASLLHSFDANFKTSEAKSWPLVFLGES